MALVGVELETFVSEPDALTTRPQLSPDESLEQIQNAWGQLTSIYRR